MADIVGIGCGVFDFMIMLDHWPEEDTKGGGKESKVQCGGPCAVAMIAASKLGVSSAYQGVVGDDVFGKIIKERLEFYGVDTSALHVIEGGISPSCAVLCNPQNASRTCIGGSRSNLPQLKPEDVDLEMLKNAKFLHVDGVNPEAALFAAKKAKEFGVKVSMDVDGAREGHVELLDYVDVIIPSEKFVYAQAHTDDVEEGAWYVYNTYKPEVLVVTQGPKGGVMIYEGKLTHYDAFHVDAIDSNGAGDVFHGAWVAATVKGMDPYEATRFASATSAIKCTHFGASEGAPAFETVQEFLKAHEN